MWGGGLKGATWRWGNCRSQWPRGLRHEMFSPAWTLGLWVRIPLEPWMFAFIVFVLSCVGSRLATGWSLVQGVLPIVYKCKITEPHKEEAKARYGLQRHIRRRRGGGTDMVTVEGQEFHCWRPWWNKQYICKISRELYMTGIVARQWEVYDLPLPQDLANTCWRSHAPPLLWGGFLHRSFWSVFVRSLTLSLPPLNITPTYSFSTTEIKR
jgi:hypothetical protein